MIVAGQVHGGLAQGIGQALLEGCVYDKATGQLLTGSYNDYAMPRADDLPNFALSTHVTLCTHNPLGVKGCGEAGAIGAPAAIANAIVDALKPLGVRHVEMPATPREKLWRCHPGHAPAASAAESELGTKGEARCTNSNITRPTSLDRRREAARRRGGQAGRRRHDADPDLEAAPRQAVASWSISARSPALKGIKEDGDGVDDRRDDPPCRGQPLGRRQARDPGAGRARRHDRRPGGAQPRHDRRLDRQQRSGGRLPGGGRRAQRHGASPTSARSPPTISSPACSRPRSARTRSSPRSSFPKAAGGGLPEIPEPGLALCDRRRVRREDRRRRARRGDRRRRPASSACRRWKRRSRKSFTADAIKDIAIPDDGLNSRHPRQRRIPRPPRQRDGPPRGRGLCVISSLTAYNGT